MRRSEILRDNGAMTAAQRPPLLRTASGFLLALALLASAALAQAKERDDHDHERAQAAVQAGQVLPLNAVLERVARDHPGQVMKVELERDDGRWIYEIKSLQADGQLVKLKVDARTGEVLNPRDRSPSRH